jgi:hypothetical protein
MIAEERIASGAGSSVVADCSPAMLERRPQAHGLWRKLGDDGLRRVAYRGG